jgi:hypothetical protein
MNSWQTGNDSADTLREGRARGALVSVLHITSLLSSATRPRAFDATATPVPRAADRRARLKAVAPTANYDIDVTLDPSTAR